MVERKYVVDDQILRVSNLDSQNSKPTHSPILLFLFLFDSCCFVVDFVVVCEGEIVGFDYCVRHKPKEDWDYLDQDKHLLDK